MEQQGPPCWPGSRVHPIAWADLQLLTAPGLGLKSISIHAFKVNPPAVLT